MPVPVHRVLANEVVRFQGEGVAAVVAMPTARHCQLEPAELADVMIRGDEPWLGRNVLSQSPIQAAAVVVAPVISFQTAKRSAITCR